MLPKKQIEKTQSTAETEAIGALLGARLKKSCPAFITLDGEMGVGKTAFVRGVCSAFRVSRVKSPTYTVVNEYRGDVCPIFHFDFYRLSDADDLTSIDFEGYLARRGLVLCEWSEKIPEAIPPSAIRVTIERTDDGDGRRITVTEPN